MTLSHEHLNAETVPHVGGSLQDRIEWVRRDHFVYYPRAQTCLDQLNWIFEQAAYADGGFPSDLEGLTIIGDSGAGKTSIIEEFIHRYPREHHATHEVYPVAHCILKDSITGLKGLYSAILSAYGHPYAHPSSLRLERVTIDQLEEVLIHTLKQTKTRLLFIDEFQHACGNNQRALLNQLKRTMLVSRVPFVPVGTPDSETVLNSDPQLSDRCPVKECSTLNYWSFDNDFRRFLAGYEQFLPFPESSGLSSKRIALEIFEKVKICNGASAGKTNLRHITRFLKKVAVKALRSNCDRILEEDIGETCC